MLFSKKLKELIYGDRGLVLSNISVQPSTKKSERVSFLELAQFLIEMNNLGYTISNSRQLVDLTSEQLNNLNLEIQTFLNTFANVKGYIFRTSFAKSDKFKEYTQEDWQAMAAQYSITYGWSDLFEYITEENPKTVLDIYSENDYSKGITTALKTNQKEITISLNQLEDIQTFLHDIVTSKTVLRESQIFIIQEVPLDTLKPLLNETITIKETEVYILQRFINEDISCIKNISLDQMVRITASIYSSYKVTGIKPILMGVQLDKTLLKDLNIKYPTKIKKLFTKIINNSTDIDYSVKTMFKYYGFWKKIFTALRWESIEKTKNKFPVFSEIKNKLYINDRTKTLNHKIEKAKEEGNYLKAVKLLSKEPGLLLRGITEYLRYTKGTKIAKKECLGNKASNDFSKETIHNKIEGLEGLKILVEEGVTTFVKKENPTSKRKIKVKKDASKFFDSKEFKDILLKSNTKLLWQVLSLLEDENLFETKTERKVQNTDIEYEKNRPLPGLDVKMVKIVKKQVKKAIKKLKQKENEYLGNVYIDEDLKNYNIEFSGRTSSGLVLSGEYLTPGSKIPYNELLGENKILRMGIAWRGKESCDIDHSLTITNSTDENMAKTVYYGYPTLSVEDEVLITSSGDITSNGNEKFSVELIDIDLNLVKKHGINEMVSSAIQYSGKTFDNYEVLWFLNVIDKKNRIIEGQHVSLKLDQMDYAIQLNKSAIKFLGFKIDIEKEYIEVLNLVVDNNKNFDDYGFGDNVENSSNEIQFTLDNRPKLITIKKGLKQSIKKEQITTDKEKADVVICSKKPLNENRIKGTVYLTPGKDGEIINKIIL